MKLNHMLATGVATVTLVTSLSSSASAATTKQTATSGSSTATAYKCGSPSPTIRDRTTFAMPSKYMTQLNVGLRPIVSYAKRYYFKNGRLTSYGLGYIGEMAGAWMVLNKSVYDQDLRYQYKYPGTNRVYDFTSETTWFFGSTQVYWEAKANSSGLTASQKATDIALRNHHKKQINYIWACVNPYTGSVPQMRWDKESAQIDWK